MVQLIISIGKNYRIYNIVKAGQRDIKFGCRLPHKNIIKYPIYFADQDWKNPNLPKYKKNIERYKPEIATVLDYDENTTLDAVLFWTEEISEFVNKIIIIPKVSNTIDSIPQTINTKQVVLGYSVPSNYGSTNVNSQEFYGRPTHLLGGSIRKQIQMLENHLHKCPIVSIDNNYILFEANKFAKYWEYPTEKYPYGRSRHIDLLQNYTIPDEALSTNMNISAAKAMYVSCCNFYDYIKHTF